MDPVKFDFYICKHFALKTGTEVLNLILILLQEAEQNHLLIYRSINDDNFKSVIVFNKEEE